MTVVPFEVAIALTTAETSVDDAIFTDLALVMLVLSTVISALAPRYITDASSPVLADRILPGTCWNQP